MTKDTLSFSKADAPGLLLPDLEIETTNREGKTFVLDPVRRKFVRLTPEEGVRQRVLQYLTRIVGAPLGLTAVEKAFEFNGMVRRADVVVHDRVGKPLILAECKAPDVVLDQAVFDQAGRYNIVVGARYVLISNGRQHYCFTGVAAGDGVRFVTELPRFEEMQDHGSHH